MKTRAALLIMGINTCCFSAFGQEAATVLPTQPHLFHIWSDANGDTHIQEIKLANNKRALISGLTMNFSGTPVGPNAKQFHNASARQFAINVFRRFCGVPVSILCSSVVWAKWVGSAVRLFPVGSQFSWSSLRRSVIWPVRRHLHSNPRVGGNGRDIPRLFLTKLTLHRKFRA
jgi:hypothetical protein